MVASRKAPADAEKTEALSADFIPVPIVIPEPNARSISALKSANVRVRYPRSKVTAKTDSARVTVQPTAGIQDAGSSGLSFAA